MIIFPIQYLCSLNPKILQTEIITYIRQDHFKNITLKPATQDFILRFGRVKNSLQFKLYSFTQRRSMLQTLLLLVVLTAQVTKSVSARVWIKYIQCDGARTSKDLRPTGLSKPTHNQKHFPETPKHTRRWAASQKQGGLETEANVKYNSINI